MTRRPPRRPALRVAVEPDPSLAGQVVGQPDRLVGPSSIAFDLARVTAPQRRITVPGRARYKGDIAADVVGRMMGPTSFSQWLVATAATYDPDSDTTVVEFASTMQGDAPYRDSVDALRVAL